MTVVSNHGCPTDTGIQNTLIMHPQSVRAVLTYMPLCFFLFYLQLITVVIFALIVGMVYFQIGNRDLTWNTLENVFDDRYVYALACYLIANIVGK